MLTASFTQIWLNKEDVTPPPQIADLISKFGRIERIVQQA